MKNKFTCYFQSDNSRKRDLWIQNILSNIPSDLKILDVGAGECQYKKYCTQLNYTSQDFCEYNGQGNKRGLQTGVWNTNQIDIISDITHIPVQDSSFDIILCSEVLEHVPDPIKAFKEMDRILRPGGYIILTAPFCSLTHFAPYHFMDGFDRYFYEHIFAQNYRIEKLDSNGNFFDYLAQEVSRIPMVVKSYSSGKISFMDNLLLSVLHKRLKKWSTTTKGSENLLCFGYMCLAQKL